MHLSQAYHNLKLAKHIFENSCVFPDWAITSCFYAAIHFFEAQLDKRYSKHGEKEAEKEDGLSAHVYRKKFIRDHHYVIYKEWSMLNHASNLARYLIGLQIPAYKYFSKQAAKDLNKKADTIRHHFGYPASP